MKKTLGLFFFFFSVQAFADDSKLVNLFRSYLDFGIYKGKTPVGEKCIIDVTQKEKLEGILMESKYKLEIFSAKASSWYGFSSTLATGGKGDCPNVKYDTGYLLEVKNTGPQASCFSSPNKSNAKGLKIVVIKLNKIEVSTLNPEGKTELSCTIEL